MNELTVDYDRCGWGTPWGCKQEIELGDDVGLVLDACPPQDVLDNGHRLFHEHCLPVSAIQATGRRRLAGDLMSVERRGRVGRAAV